MFDRKTLGAMFFAFFVAVFGGFVGWILASDEIQGDFITNVLLSFCAGLLASVVFTFIIQSVLSRQAAIDLEEYQKINMSVQLYQHFHSLEMLEARCRVERLLDSIKENEHTISELHKNLYMNSKSTDDKKDWVALSGLLRFYESMYDLIERGLLDKETARKNYKFYFD